MTNLTQVPNRLINEKSPYLLQHAYNPVDWWPWCEEAFAKAKAEDKPIFLSIGYSTCHWCHVMAHESFENEEVAHILNDSFISVKVDKEERPDVDGLYMQVCQSMTGSGGWPLTVMMTPDQKPFFAGTYLPRHSRHGTYGLVELLTVINQQWEDDASGLLRSANEITTTLSAAAQGMSTNTCVETDTLMDTAARMFTKTYDTENGGFGRAPKFPSPHNLVFLMKYHRVVSEDNLLAMAEKTLTHMYKGGLFDHIGYGFSRYSTDANWLAPHFEKMLYDNALLIMANVYAFAETKNAFYKQVALKTVDYIRRELTNPAGGFYCAQDADSEGEEGRYYVFTPSEIHECLGAADGARFCDFFDISEMGNFDGKNIPNRLKHANPDDDSMDGFLPKVYEYRKDRASLHRDDKVLSSWNGLTIASLATASRLLNEPSLFNMAEQALRFVEDNLMDDGYVFTSFREGRRSEQGFLDDYAFMGFAYLEMYNTSLVPSYLDKARHLHQKTVELFFDREQGGYYVSGMQNESLIFRMKETFDGAIPSGNAVMAYNTVLLSILDRDAAYEEVLHKHFGFMNRKASEYPAGHCFYWLAVLLRDHPPAHIVVVLSPDANWEQIKSGLPSDAIITVLSEENPDYPLLNQQTTYYLCQGNQCRPPSNDMILLP